jgi:hypothetical protein
MAGGALLDSTVLQLDLVRLLLLGMSEIAGRPLYNIYWTPIILRRLEKRLCRLLRASRTPQQAREVVEELNRSFPAAMIEEDTVEKAARGNQADLQSLGQGQSYLLAAAIAAGAKFVVSTDIGPPFNFYQFVEDMPEFVSADEFLVRLVDTETGVAAVAENFVTLRRQADFNSNSDMLDAMRRAGLRDFAQALGRMEDRVF